MASLADSHFDLESPSNVSINDNILEGNEPGASSERYLVTSDYFEETDSYLEAPKDDVKRTRNGTIKEIKKEAKKSARTSLSSRNSNFDNSNQSSSTSLDSLNTSSQTENDSEFSCSSQELEKQTEGDLINQVQQMKLERAASLVSEHDPELEYVQSEEWRNHKKHVFIISQSGKPIYSRYGNEEKLVTLFGVMQALVSFIHHAGPTDTLKCMVAGQRKFVFFIKEHLILVAVTSKDECVRHVNLQLSYVYNQVLSVLTLAQINKIFHQRLNYDLRRMLTGTEKFIDNLLRTMDVDTSYLLGAVRCLPLSCTVRDTITQTIVQHCKVKDLVYAIMISNNQLVTVVGMKKFPLHPQDLHLVLNLVQSSDSFKTAESWLPICLPKFDSSGFLHTYISYLDEPCNACLLLLTVNNEQFSVLSECKQKVVERLNRYSCLQAIAESVSTGGYTTKQVGVPELRHYIYKSRSTAQFTCPRLEAPYITTEQKERLHSLYLNVHGRMHSHTRPLKIMYQVTQYESILGWVTNGFELYAAFSPLIMKHSAISCVNKLLKWMKKEENRLFILSPTTF